MTTSFGIQMVTVVVKKQKKTDLVLPFQVEIWLIEICHWIDTRLISLYNIVDIQKITLTNQTAIVHVVYLCHQFL